MSDDLERLHVGNTCSIFLKTDETTGKTVALKVLMSDLPRPEELAQLKNDRPG